MENAWTQSQRQARQIGEQLQCKRGSIAPDPRIALFDGKHLATTSPCDHLAAKARILDNART